MDIQKMREKQITIRGKKQGLYVLCPDCEVWTKKKDYKMHKLLACRKYQKTLEVRKKAEAEALGFL